MYSDNVTYIVNSPQSDLSFNRTSIKTLVGYFVYSQADSNIFYGKWKDLEYSEQFKKKEKLEDSYHLIFKDFP